MASRKILVSGATGFLGRHQSAAGAVELAFRIVARESVAVPAGTFDAFVVEGKGTSRIGDKTISWGPKDIFSMPHNNWITHQAETDKAVLFLVTDRDTLKRLDLLKAHPWLRGTRVTFSVSNLFNSRQRVTDATGVTPISYQPDYQDPIGRTVRLSLRKLFF